VLRQAVSSAEQDKGGVNILHLPKTVLQSWLQLNEVLSAQPKDSRCSTAITNDARLLDFLLVRSFCVCVAAYQKISSVVLLRGTARHVHVNVAYRA
jgi:hypothetical protein